MRKKMNKDDTPLLKQFKKWATRLMRVNPHYVQSPRALRDYVRGPNWDDPDPECAHYKISIKCYGEELLGLFERLRSTEEGIEEYRGLLKQAGIEEEK